MSIGPTEQELEVMDTIKKEKMNSKIHNDNMLNYYNEIKDKGENGKFVVIPESIILKDLIELREARSHTSVSYDLR